MVSTNVEFFKHFYRLNYEAELSKTILNLNRLFMPLVIPPVGYL